MKILHITSGEAAANTVAASVGTNDVLAWHDVLYEGETPEDHMLKDMSKARAKFLSDAGHGSYKKILTALNERDDVLRKYNEYDELVLWFGHTLYEQLQMIQIMKFLAIQEDLRCKISLININDYSDIKTLHITQFNTLEVREIHSMKKIVTSEMLELAKNAWLAFCYHTPEKMNEFIKQDLSALIYLKNALIRYMMQFPSKKTGLSFAQQYILQSINDGVIFPQVIFNNLPEYENKYYMGMTDGYFWKSLVKLINSKERLIEWTNGKLPTPPESLETAGDMTLEISEKGQDMLAGKIDWVKINQIDRYHGGTHVTNDNMWRFDEDIQQLIKE